MRIGFCCTHDPLVDITRDRHLFVKHVNTSIDLSCLFAKTTHVGRTVELTTKTKTLKEEMKKKQLT